MSLHWIWIVLVVVLGSKGLGRWWVRRGWRGKVQALLESVPADRVEVSCESLEPEQADTPHDQHELPAPLARYLRMAQPEGWDVRVLRLMQEGRMRTDPSSERWMDFEAEQVVVPGAPGFVWNARVALRKWVHVRVLDSYVKGQGGGQVSLHSEIPLGCEQGGKGYEMLAWEGHLHDYEVRQGLRIPMAAEVGWYVDGQWKAVWEGRITEAEFTFDRDL